MRKIIIIALLIGLGLAPLGVYVATADSQKVPDIEVQTSAKAMAAVASTPHLVDPCAGLSIARGLYNSLTSNAGDIEPIADEHAQEARYGRNCAPADEPFFVVEPGSASTSP